MAFSKYNVTKTGSTYIILGPSGRQLPLVSRYLAALDARCLSKATIRAYAYDLLALFRWLKPRRKSFKGITGRDLLLWIEFQKKAQAKPASINRRLSAAESFYRFCYGKPVPRATRVAYPAPFYKKYSGRRAHGLFLVRRKDELKLRVKEPRRLIDVLEADEVNRFLSHVSRYRDLAIVFLMLLCGLRSCEVLSLTLGQVDFAMARIRVWGKGNKERMLPLPERLMIVMKKYLKLERPSEVSHDRFFLVLQGKTRGEPLTAEGLRMLFRYRRKICQIKGARPHGFRHCFGTNMARYGVTLPILQKMMGHSDFKTTLRYINLAMRDVNEEYQRAIVRIEEKYDEGPAS